MHVAFVMWLNLHIDVYSKMSFKCCAPFKFVSFLSDLQCHCATVTRLNVCNSRIISSPLEIMQHCITHFTQKMMKLSYSNYFRIL